MFYFVYIFITHFCFRLFKFMNYIVSAPPIPDQRILSSRGKSKRAWKRKSSGMFIFILFCFVFCFLFCIYYLWCFGFLMVNLHFPITYIILYTTNTDCSSTVRADLRQKRRGVVAYTGI